MALTPTEEAQTRQLIAQEAPLLSLASNEPTITSKLGATKVNLSQLPAATVPADADIYLVRQGTTDKSVAGSVLKTYFATAAPASASETVAGIVRLATAAETLAGTSQLLAVDPANLAISHPSVQGLAKNFQASANGLSAPITVTADELVVENTANAYRTLRAVSVTPSLANANGANGLDTGTKAASTWYAVWIIWNGTTTAGLLSLNFASPTMPSGYTHKALVSAIRTDATGNTFPRAFKQINKKWQYVVTPASNTTAMPLVFQGSTGTYSLTAPTYASTSIATLVPTAIAQEIILVPCNQYNNGTVGNCIAAPNNSYSGAASTNPPPIYSDSGLGRVSSPCHMLLESSNIFVAGDTGGSALFCAGFTLNI